MEPSKLGQGKKPSDWSKRVSEVNKRIGKKPPSRKGIKFTPEAIAKRRKTLKEIWDKKGRKSPIHEQIRRSLEYKLWRTSVFERDNYTCIWCGARNGNGTTFILHADHIKPFAYYPELRFAIDNGRTLCRECHLTTDTYGYNPKYKSND
jgi:5-methylcytosine-specific restriction endonuclease McrA